MPLRPPAHMILAGFLLASIGSPSPAYGEARATEKVVRRGAQAVWSHDHDGPRRNPGVLDKTLHTWRHGDAVRNLAFSPGGTKVLTGSWDNTAVLRDVQSGESLHTWRHGSPVSAVTFTPDGTKVMTGSWDDTAVLRDVQSGRALHTWQHGSHVYTIAFSPDGTKVLTSSGDKTAVLRDVQSGRTLHTWRHGGTVGVAAFSPDGTKVLTGSNDDTAVLRDVQSGRPLHTWQHGGTVGAAAFSPDGTKVLTGSNDDTAVLRDVQSGQTVHTWRHDGHVSGLAFSPDGTQALTGSSDKTVALHQVLFPLEAYQVALKDKATSALRALQSLSPELEWERQRFASNRPVRDEFESSANFEKRVRAYNQAIADLDQRIRAYLASRPTRLPTDRLAQIAAETLPEVFGDPALSNVRYDPDTETFYADVDPPQAQVLGIPKTFVLGRPIPNWEARSVMTSLRAAKPVFTFEMSSEGQLRWRDAQVAVGRTQYALNPAEADFRTASVQTTVPIAEVPAITQAAPLPVEIPTVKVESAHNPELAALAAKAEALRREKARKEAEKARKEALEKEIQRLEAERRSLQAGGPDDLAPRIDALTEAKPNATRYLFAVGIRDYHEVSAVPFADSSAERFAQLSVKMLGVPRENVELLTNDDATGTRIKARLASILNRVKPGDTLFFYYAGHGVPSRDGKTAYVLPYDGGEESYFDEALRLDALYAKLSGSPSVRVVGFVDACFSGRTGPDSLIFKGVAPMALVPTSAVPNSDRMTLLVAGEGNQFANEYKEKSHRLFSYHVMKGLLEGRTAIQDLFTYARTEVDRESRRRGVAYTQTPVLKGNPDAALAR